MPQGRERLALRVEHAGCFVTTPRFVAEEKIHEIHWQVAHTGVPLICMRKQALVPSAITMQGQSRT